MDRAKEIISSQVVEIIFRETLARLYMLDLYGEKVAYRDSFISLAFEGPPGVGKSVSQLIAAREVARFLSEKRGRSIDVAEVTLRSSEEEAVRVAERVVSGEAIPYLHLYLPQTRIWHLEGTPSPSDNVVRVGGRPVPINRWRVDPFVLPFLDYSDRWREPVPAFLVLDEYNMASQEVLRALFQLARAAELGRVTLNPLTTITLVGNTPDTNIYATRRIPAPLRGRTETYIIKKVDVSSWLNFMREIYGSKWASEVGAFLLLNPEHLLRRSKTDPDAMQTPRDWTHVALRVYVYKKMWSEGVLTREKLRDAVDQLVHSLLLKDTADELIGFIHGLRGVNMSDVLRRPELIASYDKNVAAYVLVRVSAGMGERYTWSRDQRERENIADRIVELIRYGVKVLGANAVSLVVTSLPMGLRLRVASKSPEITRLAADTRRLADEIEEMLT